jgi:hypothetical protein
MKLLGITSVGFYITDLRTIDQILHFSDTGEKWEGNETVHQLDFKKAYESVTLIKMCVNETYSKDLMGRHLSNNFPIQNGLKKEMFYCHCFSTSFRICH